MKKKGFTLVELLAVITLLGLIALITIPVITNTMSKQKEKLYYDQLNQLILAAQNWGTDNIETLSTLNNKCSNDYTITLAQLRNESSNSNNAEEFVSYLDKDFVNPKTDKNFLDNEISIKVYKNNKSYIYCIQTNDCMNTKNDEYKNIANNICCDGDTVKQRVNACILNK